MVTIGVIVGSTRPARMGNQVARWVCDVAAALPGVDVHLLDLEEVGLPFLDEPESASSGIYTHPHTSAWSERVRAVDAVLIVTPEYNSSFPAPLKNALDFLSVEWRRMPVGVVGYGMSSAGTRAIAALMPVLTALRMLIAGTMPVPLRQRVDAAGRYRPTAADDEGLRGLVTDVVALAELVKREQFAAR